jgi:hypothetical protein
MIIGITYKSIVLGAWGCGAFGNDGREIAELFYQALERNFKASRVRPTRMTDTSGDAFRAMHHSSLRDARESVSSNDCLVLLRSLSYEGGYRRVVFAIVDWSRDRRFIGPFQEAFRVN